MFCQFEVVKILKYVQNFLGEIFKLLLLLSNCLKTKDIKCTGTYPHEEA